MLEGNPLLSINVRVLKYFSVVLNRDWRVFAFVAPVCLMNSMQFVYVFRVWGDLGSFILNTFFAFAIFNALLRTCLIIRNRNQIESFMHEIDALYREIDSGNDEIAKYILSRATQKARRISIFNLAAAFFDVLGALFVPVFSDSKIHPFGVAVPGVDMTRFPVYEIFYIMQFPLPPILAAMYMPFVNLFASFCMFGKALLEILQHRLNKICRDATISEKERFEELKSCIDSYQNLSCYVSNLNSLVTYIIGIEFLLYSAIICFLLFCMNTIDSYVQNTAVAMYIFTMLYVLFTYYWQANELMSESSKVAEAAYAMEWYNCSPQFQRKILLFIMRSQVPFKIMVGNVYPMTLETFQSLLNASYSYFTLLRGLSEN